ncbi:MAG: hypothetical protein JXB42_01255 [Deltaproteobacteria bacterium]|nr:hypothetical protein [Deltaproteobacteria bacterium]
MKTCCYRCKKKIEIDGKVGRSETCPFCGSDLHVCFNCLFYSPSAYNSCHEPQAERVVDKDRRNFCEYFTFGDSAPVEQDRDREWDSRNKLESLFKK